MKQAASQTETESAQSGYLSRIVALTDGVIAIAITLLVLDIAIPEIPSGLVDDQLGEALSDLKPQVFGFVLSFGLIAYFWLAHRLIFSHLRTVDFPMILINLFFLLMIAFVPFAAGLLAEYLPHSLAIACYASVMALAGLSQLAMVAYPSARGHFHQQVTKARFSHTVRKIAVAPIIYLIMIPIAFVDGWLALSLLILLPVVRYAVDRHLLAPRYS